MKENTATKKTEYGQLFNLIQSQHQSEKSTNALAQNQYVFKVPCSANKTEIKKAIEYLFEVQVVSINTVNNHPKVRRFKNVMGRRKKFKKAYVKLQQGNQINLSEIN